MSTKYRGSNGTPIVTKTEPETQVDLAIAEIENFDLYHFPIFILSNKVENKRCKAKERGHSFEIRNILEILEVINKTKGLCGYTGLPFKNANDVTFERIDPHKGYTVENTIFTTNDSNNAKSALDQFEKSSIIPTEMKIKLLNKVAYRLSKQLKQGR